MDDSSSSSAASYIKLVQHLIEKCICYNLKREECMETLEKHANIKPVITSIVWKELEKENREFFETYQKKGRVEKTTTTTQKKKNPSDEQRPASSPSNKSSREDSGGDDESSTASSTLTTASP